MPIKQALVVENNIEPFELVRFTHEKNGYEIFPALNGHDGVNAAIKQMPDLVELVDIVNSWTNT